MSSSSLRPGCPVVKYLWYTPLSCWTAQLSFQVLLLHELVQYTLRTWFLGDCYFVQQFHSAGMLFFHMLLLGQARDQFTHPRLSLMDCCFSWYLHVWMMKHELSQIHDHGQKTCVIQSPLNCSTFLLRCFMHSVNQWTQWIKSFTTFKKRRVMCVPVWTSPTCVKCSCSDVTWGGWLNELLALCIMHRGAEFLGAHPSAEHTSLPVLIFRNHVFAVETHHME